MAEKNLDKSSKRHVLCEMNNTTAPLSTRYRAREKYLGSPREEKITLYADVPSAADKENLNNSIINETENLPVPPYISKIRAQFKDKKGDKKLTYQEPLSQNSCLPVKSNLSGSKDDSYLPLKEVEVKKEKADTTVKMNVEKQNNEISPPITPSANSKPKVDKIPRPPNAFMVFAKEQRQKIQEKNPNETNRKVSTILGHVWRTLALEEKSKYFIAANELEREHKEKYPDYVYSPTEARKRKKTKLLKSQVPKEAHSKGETENLGSPGLQNKKEINVETTTRKTQKSDKDMDVSGAIKNEYNHHKLYSQPSSPMGSPIYWPYPSQWMSPYQGPTRPHCYCQSPGCGGPNPPSVSGYRQHLVTAPGHQGMPTRMGSSYPPPMFHPAVWNPWMMFPTPFYPFNSSSRAGDLYKTWMGRNPYSPMPPPSFEDKPGPTAEGTPNLSQECSKVDPPKESQECSKIKENAMEVDSDSDHSSLIVDENDD